MPRSVHCFFVTAVFAFATTVYAPPKPPSVPHFKPFRPEPKPLRHEQPKQFETNPYDTKISRGDSRNEKTSHLTENREARVERFDFTSGNDNSEGSQDRTDSVPLVFCALPRDDAFLNIFGDRFTSNRDTEIRQHEATARGIYGAETRISHYFRRAELLAAIGTHRGKRPFVLVCHTEGSNADRKVRLGDFQGAEISENDLRLMCKANDTELFLVSCESKDLKSSQRISYGEAFRITKLVMERRAASSSMSVGELKALFVETAKQELAPGGELRISFGSGIKHVVIVTAIGPAVDTDDNGFPWYRTIFATVVGIAVVTWLAHRWRQSEAEREFAARRAVYSQAAPMWRCPHCLQLGAHKYDCRRPR